MALNNLQELRQQESQGPAIARRVEITVDGVKKPQSRIRGMIETFTAAFGKKIRNEALTNGIGKIAQDPAGLQEAMGRQGETFQADHGVSSPIGKPVIACDYRAHVIARGIGSGRV